MSFDNHDFSQNGISEDGPRNNQGGGYGNNNQQSGQQGYNKYQGGNSYGNGNRNSGGSSWSNGGNRGKWNGGGGNGGQSGGFNSFRRNNEPQGPVELYKPYVITGNKEAPDHILQAMKGIVEDLEQQGFTMRSGGMEGPEDYVEKVATKKEIHLPWKGFNDKESPFSFTTPAAKELAGKYHSGFDGLKPAIQTFLAKNVKMLMGKDLKSPALFMVVWTEDGAETLQEKSVKSGNTGHAIAVACSLPIPVFNLAKPDGERRLRDYLKLNKATQATTAPVEVHAAPAQQVYQPQAQTPVQQQVHQPVHQPAQQTYQQPAPVPMQQSYQSHNNRGNDFGGY
jgi:hypothetical protein